MRTIRAGGTIPQTTTHELRAEQSGFTYHPGNYRWASSFHNTRERNDMPQSILALFNLGGGEIILILVLLLILTVPMAAAGVVIFLIVRANKRKQEASQGSVPPHIPPTKS